jgi:small GTP-binding protein
MATGTSWLVTIVGRPNVGKSTLFNRIIGRRHAIVDDMPGVTRDRHYGEAEWAGKSFTLVDTGGFVPASEDTMEIAIREQATIAIEEANLILFVVDAEAGIVPAERDIAGIRKAGKRVVWSRTRATATRRKAASENSTSSASGDPIPISALVGRKIGDLLDLITRDIRDRTCRTDPGSRCHHRQTQCRQVVAGQRAAAGRPAHRDRHPRDDARSDRRGVEVLRGGVHPHRHRRAPAEKQGQGIGGVVQRTADYQEH